jgi:hypothetical protein
MGAEYFDIVDPQVLPKSIGDPDQERARRVLVRDHNGGQRSAVLCRPDYAAGKQRNSREIFRSTFCRG